MYNLNRKIATLVAVVLLGFGGSVAADGDDPDDPTQPPVPIPGPDGLPPPLPGDPVQTPIQTSPGQGKPAPVAQWAPTVDQQFAAQQRALYLTNLEIPRIQWGSDWSWKSELTACGWPGIPVPDTNNPYNRMFFICYSLLVRDGVEHLITAQVTIYEDGTALVGNMLIWDDDPNHNVEQTLVPYDANNNILPH